MLPIVDISPLAADGRVAREAVARRIGNICETVGFLYVSGHGVSDDLIAATRDVTERFFNQPESIKRPVKRPEGVLRGYIPTMPFGQNVPEAPPTTYEGYNVGVEIGPDDPETAASGGIYAPNIWSDTPTDFRTTVTEYFNAVDRVSKRLMEAFALALGQPKNRFASMFEKQLSNISLLHYHARPEMKDTPPDDTVAHHDSNAITVLLPSPVGGLQVQGTDGAYHEVAPEPGCFVVNIGTMVESWSGGRFRSTMHRVHPPRHLERYSIGFFAVPNHNVVVEPLPGLEVTGDPAAMKPRHAGAELKGFIDNFDRQVRELENAA